MCIYGMFAAIHSKVQGNRVVMLLWLDALHFTYSIGFRTFYGRVSHIKSFHLITTNEGYMTAKKKVMKEGKELTLSFVRWPIVPTHYQEYILRKYKIKASL